MQSQWFEYKDKAVELRKQGLSYGEIQKLLSIPKSTLSHWLRNVVLTKEQKIRLDQNYGNGLIKARVKAAQWRRNQKELRLKVAEDEALSTLHQIKINDNIIELALAMLYMGEGAKNNSTSMGSSSPLVLKFFIKVLIKIYNVEPTKIRCDLHLRSDQNTEEMKSYWSIELNLLLSNFRSVIFDLRTSDRKTYAHYKGVCLVNCGTVAIQRKLISLYNQFCRKVLDERAHSSVG